MAAAFRAPEIHGVSSNTSVTSFEGGDCGLLVRKTPLQLQTLENLYSDDKYPTQGAMEDYALALGLTYKQVRSWFIERRRKEKNGGAKGRRMSNGNTGRRKRKKKKVAEDCSETESEQDEYAVSKRPVLMQDMLLPADYILTKVFRKDGPPLGAEFDSPPSALQRQGASSDSECYRAGSDVEQRFHNMDKVTGPSVLDGRQPGLGTSLNRHGKGKGFITTWRTLSCQNDSQATKRKKVLSSGDHTSERRHGAGKGLMTLWRTLHPASKGYPTDFSFPNRGADVSEASNSRQKRPLSRNKRPQKRIPAATWRRLEEKLQEKNSVKRRKVNRGKNETEKKSNRVECRLALGPVTTEDQISHAMLVDDEELELRELQAGPNPLTCGAHFSNGARSGCPLCKGLLAKFPPDSVRMKQPFCNVPWSSSLELVKKFFKVFRFLYTYALILDTCPFTMDEFIQAFHDKDSHLLGELHVCLLKFILSDIEKDLFGDVLPHTSKSCMFLSLLHSVQSRKSIINSWNKSLNPLTWTEILRQVLLAAGYGSADGGPRKGSLKKDVNPMTKYGLCPGTLKAELFCILLEQGNQGFKLSDLTESPRIVGLNHADTKEELQDLISSILAGDITLFEKISSSTYRLRLKNLASDDDHADSDPEDSGSIDYSPKDCAIWSSSNEGDRDSRSANSSKTENSSKDNFEIYRRSPGAEIDESHSGEAWMLGLMEGEYSDLSIEEKLNIMEALVDLLYGGSSIRQEVPRTATSEFVPRIYQHGSGAKVKRASVTQHSLFPARDVAAQNEGLSSLTELQPIDSACLFRGKDICRKDLHPMQSICLGSDRRYNRYWLFLGPCHASDPGHRRVYFESSEDGHYEIIDTEEALCALVGALDGRGRREAALLASLKKRGSIICEEMSAGEVTVLSDGLPTPSDISELDRIISESSSPVSDVDNHSCLNKMLQCSVASSSGLISSSRKNLGEEKMKWSRLQAYDLWIWKSFYSNLHSVKHRKCSYLDTLTRCETCHDLYWRDEKHCRFCHITFELDFDLEEKYAIHAATCQHKEDSDLVPKHKVLPSQLQALKAAVHAIELAMPENSLIGAWTKSAHKLWVNRLRRTSSLQELLQALANFVGAINEDWLSQCNVAADNDASNDIIASFKNIPRTSSAIALWLDTAFQPQQQFRICLVSSFGIFVGQRCTIAVPVRDLVQNASCPANFDLNSSANPW